MSDKIVVMADGEIQQIGTPEEIYNEPKNLFVADFIGESNIFKGTMLGYHKVRFCGTEFDCVDDYAKDMVIDAVIRPEDIVITEESKGQFTGEVISCDFKGTFYIVVVQAGKNEIEIHSLNSYAIGTKVGMSIEPDNIHLIPYDTSINHYEGKVVESKTSDKIHVEFEDFQVDIDPAILIPGAVMEDWEVVDAEGNSIDLMGTRVEASFIPSDADLTDDAEQGLVQGNIFSFIYVDDHYRYTVRTKSEEDYVVNDEDLWNQEDYVGVIIPMDKMTYKIVEGDADEE